MLPGGCLAGQMEDMIVSKPTPELELSQLLFYQQLTRRTQ